LEQFQNWNKLRNWNKLQNWNKFVQIQIKEKTKQWRKTKRKQNKNNLTWAGPLSGAMRVGPNPSRNKRELGFPAASSDPRLTLTCVSAVSFDLQREVVLDIAARPPGASCCRRREVLELTCDVMQATTDASRVGLPCPTSIGAPPSTLASNCWSAHRP
jgi:hypothetical protein